MTTKEIKNKLKISEKTCIHCPTLELAKQVKNIFQKVGLNCGTGQYFHKFDYWDIYEENTVYHPFSCSFSDLEYAQRKGYKIISAEEFIALHTENEEFDLENYEPKGDLKGFPKEIIARMLECQEEQGNKIDVSVFEKSRTAGGDKKGFFWQVTKEKFGFWSEVILAKNFNLFFAKYPKKEDNQDNSQEFRVGDKVIDIIKGEIGFVKNIDLNNKFTICQLEVNLSNNKTKSYSLEGKYFSNNKKPQLLHYRDDYDYNVIDFNNLPKRQEPKRWRANRHNGYWIIDNFFKVYEFSENGTDIDEAYNNSGNYFQTEEEAQEVADKLNKYFQELIKSK